MIETGTTNQYGLLLSGWLCFSACSWLLLSSFNTVLVYKAKDGEEMAREVVEEEQVVVAADGGLQAPRLHTIISSPGSQRMIGNRGDQVSGLVLWAVPLQGMQWEEAHEEEEITPSGLAAIMPLRGLHFLLQQGKALGLEVQGVAKLD